MVLMFLRAKQTNKKSMDQTVKGTKEKNKAEERTIEWKGASVSQDLCEDKPCGYIAKNKALHAVGIDNANTLREGMLTMFEE